MTYNDFKVQTEIPVYWGDMDALRHVNNVKYVQWGEVARVDFLNATGMYGHKEHYAIIGFQSVKYIAPAFYPDTMQIGTAVEEIKEDRIILKSYFFSKTHNKLLAIKTHEVYLLDMQSHKKINLPEDVVEWITPFKRL